MLNPLSVKQLSGTGKGQTAIGIQVQTYCSSILNQPLIDFSSFSTLSSLGLSINSNMNISKEVSLNYLTVIQPDIIKNINNILNYYTLNSIIASSLSDGITKAQWLSALTQMRDFTSEYGNQAAQVSGKIGKFNNVISLNTRELNGFLIELNTKLQGDNGVLAELTSSLNNIQKKIDGAIAGTATSALSIIAGAFLIAIGAVASFITAGTSSALVAGGIGLVAIGTGGEAASAKTLQELNQAKTDIISQQNMLKNETLVITGVASAMSSLSLLSSQAIQAASQMKNMWDNQAGDLTNLSNQLSNGLINTGYLRQLFLDAANNTIPPVLADAKIISLQMAGISSVILDDCSSLEKCVSKYTQ